MLTLVRRLGRRKQEGKQTISWGLFLCPACNREFELRMAHRNRDKSCGCARGKNITIGKTKHGATLDGQTHLYGVWKKMKERCNDSNCVQYQYYGGRGVTVDPRWHDFATFEAWATENGYQSHLEIDRENNDIGYTPENCRWVTQTVNKRNRSNVVLSMEKARYIRQEHAAGIKTIAQIAVELSVHVRNIYPVLANRTWKEGKE